MADQKNDIIREVEKTEAELLEYKKAQFAENPATRLPPPSQAGSMPKALIPELLEMLKIGRKSSMFNGIERCIRIRESGTPNQHHCLSMMVNNLTANSRMCTQCDRIRDPNAHPTVINSSMIKLPQKDLEEMGMAKDPSYQEHAATAKAEDKPKRSKKAIADVEAKPRRAMMKTPSKVMIEMSISDLKNDPLVLKVMLQKTLDAIFELPITKFSEAEDIRVVKEKVEAALNQILDSGAA